MTTFSVWAPAARAVSVLVGDRTVEMTPDDRPGWWTASDPDAAPGARYGFRLDDGDALPDPRSLRQPNGPEGLSQLYDHDAFAWTDAGWRGAPLPGGVVYELHVGTFTPDGTFDAAIGRLDYLRDLGVTAVEVMPVAAFPGRRGWGYDGISLWAVHEPYGGPDGLKRFTDACHARGIGVLLDVVYNHVGIGSRLADFGPYFTDAHSTPWGPAVNLDQAESDEVRAFIVENALSWLRDFHLDGLRLDAVHALADNRAVHLLEELSVRTDALAAQLNRNLVLIAESDRNDPRLVTAREAGGYGLSAQWSDDFHHALHSALTGERQGYYRDFGSLAALAKTLTRVFFHDGTWSSFRGRTHGRPVDVERIPGHRFVGFLQDHDQIGNRAVGDRISGTLPAGLLKVGAGLLLTAPFTPMLFMGEEWAASTPWQYFTDHPDPEFGAAVSRGRRAEFAAHGWSSEDVPDPQAESTFAASRLDWAERDDESHAELLAWYRELIALRRAWPELTDPRLGGVAVRFDEAARWLVLRRGRLRVIANFAATAQPVPLAVELDVTADGDTEDAGAPVTSVVLAASGTDVTVAGNAALMAPSSLAVVRL